MSQPNYQPLAHEWGQLFPMTLDIKVDGPFKRRIEDLTREVSREALDLAPVMWSIVLSAGFILLRMPIRSESTLVPGLKKLLAETLEAMASGL